MSDSKSLKLAFVGLGIMGGPMAGHLLSAGYALSVHTRTRARAAELLARGAAWADSPADAAAKADIVFICVPDTPDVRNVIEGENGISRASRPGMIVVDHSTISPSATAEMAESLARHGVTLVDAPVSGGDVGARNATLSIMVGGEAHAVETIRPLLEKMGRTITHAGPAGSGQSTKLVNQVLVSLTNLAVCEALTFARASGLDGARTLAAVGGGAAASWQLSNLGPRMLAGDFAPGFMIDLQLKDLRLVQQAAEQMGLNLTALKYVKELFESAVDDGRGRDGTQALLEVVRRRSHT